MEAVIRRLTEIEKTAENILDHAEIRKGEIEKEIYAQTESFDRELAEETEKKLSVIRGEAEAKMQKLLEAEKERHHSVIDNLEEEYKKNKDAYAQEILERIITM